MHYGSFRHFQTALGRFKITSDASGITQFPSSFILPVLDVNEKKNSIHGGVGISYYCTLL